MVVGPAWVSALTARRLRPLLGDIPVIVVANRAGEWLDHPGLASTVRVPFDPSIEQADRLGVAPLDHCPGSPAVEAISYLAERLLTQEVSV